MIECGVTGHRCVCGGGARVGVRECVELIGFLR